jgi:hypothetical protein
LHRCTTDHFGDAGSPAIALWRVLPHGDRGNGEDKTTQIKVVTAMIRNKPYKTIDLMNNTLPGTGVDGFAARPANVGDGIGVLSILQLFIMS